MADLVHNREPVYLNRSADQHFDSEPLPAISVAAQIGGGRTTLGSPADQIAALAEAVGDFEHEHGDEYGPEWLNTVDGRLLTAARALLAAQQAPVDIVTPCHGVPPRPQYVYEGRPYMQERVVDAYGCPADGCYRGWDADGKAAHG